MTLEQVKQEIKEQAEEEAKKLLGHAKEQARKEMEAAHKLVDAFETETQDMLKKELDILEKRYEAGMKLAGKKLLLEKRKVLLEQTTEEAKKTIIHLPASEKKKILAKLLEKAKKQCSIGKVYCATQDVAVAKSLWSSVGAADIFGGIIVESKDGTMRVDESFDALLKEVQEKKLQQIAGILFV